MPYKDPLRRREHENERRRAGIVSHGRSRAEMQTFFDAPEFVAWDGEGITVREPEGVPFAEYDDALATVTDLHVASGIPRGVARGRATLACAPFHPRPGVHIYTLLHNSRGDYLEDQDGIRTRDALRFFLETQAKYPRAKHVVFSGSYDVNMLLRGTRRDGTRTGISREDLVAILHAPEWGRVVSFSGEPFSVGVRARRKFFVGEHVAGHVWAGRTRAASRRSFTLWDVWGFYQSSFIDALHAWFGDEVYSIVPHYDRIAEMKAARASFAHESAEKIREYCFLECRALEALTLRLAQSLATVKLYPARWDGAGAVAGALLKRENIRAHIAEPPEHLAFGVQCAYAGGRIEITQIGTFDAVHDYDVTSCYPSQMLAMPALTNGWGPAQAIDGFTLSLVEYDFPEDVPWYPLFFRNPDGSILFPAQGIGWYYGPEVSLALAFAARYGGQVTVKETWAPNDDGTRPFAFVRDLYEARAEYKRTGSAAQHVLKLGLNSLYGKLCQQAGGTAEKLPPYFSLAWGGYITSASRAQLGRAALRADPSRIVAFQTDGLFTTEALPDLITPGLGGWECKTPDGGLPTVVAQAGVYWYGREAWSARYRGFDRTGMETPERVLTAWSRYERSIDVDVTRFVTTGSSLASERLWPYWASWRTAPRTLAIDGRSSKREPIARRVRPDRRGVALDVAYNHVSVMGGAGSAPYRVAWVDEPARTLVDGVSQAVWEEEATHSFL